MTTRRLSLYLVLGMIAGLFITACAGVATGKIDLPGAGDVFISGPVFDAQSAAQPAFEIARPAHSATFLFEKARPVVLGNLDANAEVARFKNYAAIQWTWAAVQQAQTETQTLHHGLCSRGGP